MEGGRKKSFATDLFGEKDKPTSSSGVFGSMFAHPSQGSGRGTVYRSENQRNGSGNPAWNPKTKGVSGGEGQSKEVSNGSYNYQQEEKAPPFHYSSSIYYGGQDVYNRPPQAAPTPVFSTFNKDGSEDIDSGGASRGNWWQGSLYY